MKFDKIFGDEKVSDLKEAEYFCRDIEIYENMEKNSFWKDCLNNLYEDLKERYSYNPKDKSLLLKENIPINHRKRLFTTEGVTKKYFYMCKRFPLSMN
jgi:hypothetical protein